MDEVDKKYKEVVDSVNTTVSRNLEKLLEARGLSQRQFCQRWQKKKYLLREVTPKVRFYCVTDFVCYAFLCSQEAKPVLNRTPFIMYIGQRMVVNPRFLPKFKKIKDEKKSGD